MSGFERSLPHLGWDPTPGSVPETQDLARRHADMVHELTTVSGLVGGIDISSWRGEAARATDTKVMTALVPAIRDALAQATAVAAASSAWVGKLAGFQAEADALEKLAASTTANLQALQGQQSMLAHQNRMLAAQDQTTPTGPTSAQTTLSEEISTANGSLAGIQTKAQELHGRYLAEAKGLAEGDGKEAKPLNEKIEPYRKILEEIMSPLDLVGADHWLEMLEEGASVPAEAMEALDKALEAAEAASDVDKLAALTKVVSAAEEAAGRLDAFAAFAPGWLKAASGALGEIRGFGRMMTGLGLVADGLSIIWPADHGAMGWVDRGAAGINGALLIANATMDEIPVAGEVVMIGTGIYLAGDFLVHQQWFRNGCKDIGNATVHAAQWVGHTVDTGVHDATKWVGNTVSSGVHDASKAVSGAFHSVTSTIGSWL